MLSQREKEISSNLSSSFRTMGTIHNFNAGPSILPKEVFEEASRAVLDFNGTGLSLLEIGHRTSLFQQVMDEARALVRQLMNLNDDQEVLLLHGGATTQFMQIPMNLLDENDIAAYTDTGVWAGKAVKEARLFGHVDIVCSGKSSTIDRFRKIFPYHRLLNICTLPRTTPSMELNGMTY